MSVLKPEEMHCQFVEAYNAGNAEAVLALYEPGATLVLPDTGQVVSGPGLRQALEEFVALKGRIEIETTRCVTAGNVALLGGKWRVTGTKPDGGPLDFHGISVEVLRRQPDGRWLYLIDHPGGG